jgi:hypothetical protein
VIDDGREIRTGLSVRDRFGFGLCFVVYTVMAAVLPLMIFTWFFLNTPSGRAPGWTVALSFLVGAAASVWFTGSLIGPRLWCLTDSELINGIRGKKRYPLSSIQKVIVGLPDQLSGTWVGELASVSDKYGTFEDYVESRPNALLLVFQDGSMLPLTLHKVMNGPLLKFTLAERLKDRVIHDYKFSEQELRLLKRAERDRKVLNWS